MSTLNRVVEIAAWLGCTTPPPECFDLPKPPGMGTVDGGTAGGGTVVTHSNNPHNGPFEWGEVTIDSSPEPAPTDGIWTIPVIVVAFYPLDETGEKLDASFTGGLNTRLTDIRAHVANAQADARTTLEQGSRWRGYALPTGPSIRFRVMERIEVLGRYPTTTGTEFKSGGYNPPKVDYKAIVEEFDLHRKVRDLGVKQIWLWGYHGDMITFWESTMIGHNGNVSNSDKLLNEAPYADKTYTIYTYNYGRGAPEFVENHCHQIESLLNHVDGRHTTPESEWGNLMFWGKFVGSNRSHKIVRPGCGWTHYCPNSTKDYDWYNPRKVESDILDWKPDGTGARSMVSCATWNGCFDDGGLAWKKFWMQSIPGADNGLTYQGNPLTNWWKAYGAWDEVVKEGWKLTNATAA